MDKIFSHRNHEKEPPTERGMYWVESAPEDNDPFAHYVFVSRDEVYFFLQNYFDDLDQYEGCYWTGPIPPLPELIDLLKAAT